jgi:hypothetical protein
MHLELETTDDHLARVLWRSLTMVLLLLMSCGRSRFVPTERYALHEVQGHAVRVSPEAEAHGAGPLLAELDERLKDFQAKVKPDACTRLADVSIWIERAENDRAMAGYHGAEWVERHRINPDKARAIEIADMTAFLHALLHDKPMAVAHELAHAYLDRGFDEPAVRRAYAEAIRSRKYEHVRDSRGAITRAYALESESEYFAELTEAYLGQNDFEPFDRAELARFDPEGFDLMVSAWGQ